VSYYVIIIEVGTENRDEAEEVAREAADDGRITKVTLAEVK
jgi:hypothetical protein